MLKVSCSWWKRSRLPKQETYGCWYSGLGVLKNSYGTKKLVRNLKVYEAFFLLLNKTRLAIICRGPNHSPPTPQRLPNCKFALFFLAVMPMAFGSCLADPTPDTGNKNLTGHLSSIITETWCLLHSSSVWYVSIAGRQVVFSVGEDSEEIKERELAYIFLVF